jgi:hypothetical protein
MVAERYEPPDGFFGHGAQKEVDSVPGTIVVADGRLVPQAIDKVSMPAVAQ